MWSQLADVLSKGDVRQILRALPPELQSELRQSYHERPLSFLSFRVLPRHPLRRQITAWCRAPSDQ